ncbi:hypothetical protein niasHT_026693 [Heterodera trifolii]|uniref:Ubiquinol-cytochrome c chaperone domain-containing protein n=1 Tax=Heterodera trifolii TaxID=157864 RepID=A0ABD2JSZ0_9BILA
MYLCCANKYPFIPLLNEFGLPDHYSSWYRLTLLHICGIITAMLFCPMASQRTHFALLLQQRHLATKYVRFPLVPPDNKNSVQTLQQLIASQKDPNAFVFGTNMAGQWLTKRSFEKTVDNELRIDGIVPCPTVAGSDGIHLLHAPSVGGVQHGRVQSLGHSSERNGHVGEQAQGGHDIACHLHISTLHNYDEGFFGDDRVLAAVVWRSFFLQLPDVSPAQINRVVRYMRETMASLARMDDMRLLVDGIERWDVAEELARLVSAEQFGTIPAPLPSFAMGGDGGRNSAQPAPKAAASN